MLHRKLTSKILRHPAQTFLTGCRTVAYDRPISPTVGLKSWSFSKSLPFEQDLPKSCQILIAGGGILGQSIAFHLTEIGYKDIILIEKSKFALKANACNLTVN